MPDTILNLLNILIYLSHRAVYEVDAILFFVILTRKQDAEVLSHLAKVTGYPGAERVCKG